MFNKILLQEEIKELVGMSLVDVTKLISTNVFEIKFNDCKLIVNCFMRLIYDGKIVFTSCDDMFSCDYLKLDQSGNKENLEKTLISKTLLNVKNITKESYISDVLVSDCADLTIIFRNGAELLIFLDSRINGNKFYEFYNMKKCRVLVGFDNKQIFLQKSNIRLDEV